MKLLLSITKAQPDTFQQPQRALQQDTEIDFTLGALSLVDGKLYRGDGQTAEVVALVDTGTSDLASGSLDLEFAFGMMMRCLMLLAAIRFAAGKKLGSG